MEGIATDSALRMEMASRSKERIAAYSPAAWAAGLELAVESICKRD
jgi:hypothetical protein